MKKVSYLMIVALVVLALASLAATPAPESGTFVAHLIGDEEVPPNDSPAQGQAIFHLSKDGTELSYKLIVANIENVTAAHIHCGASGVSGGVGVNLFTGGTPGSGRVDGILAEGTITAPNPGNACGWQDLDDVLAAIVSGNAYVNVHTNDGDPLTSGGPGDIPSGEIRGQIR